MKVKSCGAVGSLVAESLWAPVTDELKRRFWGLGLPRCLPC